MKKLIYTFIVLTSTLLLVELGLRINGTLQTYSETNFNQYQSPYNTTGVKPLYVWQAEQELVSKQAEFTFSYTTNAFGLLNTTDIDSLHPSNTVVFIGDSFVFGVGASQDSSLPVLLEQQIQIPFVNAGVPGSDPFFEKVLIDSIYKPLGFNKYIIMVNFSDIYDYLIRGGLERFAEKNKVNYKKAPWIEGIYKYSHLVRAFVHSICGMDYSLLPAYKLKKLKDEAIVAYTKLILSLSKDVDCIVIVQPYARQYAKNNGVLTEVLNYSYLEKLDSSLRANHIKTINLDSNLQKLIHPDNYLDYSWELDGHYNAKGYVLISEILANELTLKYPEFIKN